MQKISLGGRRTRDGIYRTLKSTVLLDKKGVGPVANTMGTGADELQPQDRLSTGKQGWETRRFK